MVDLPSPVGSRNFTQAGARVPIMGGAETLIGGGIGVAQDCHDLGTERFANGLAKGKTSFCWFGSLGLPGFDSGREKAFEGIPALRRAIFVVSLLNILSETRCWGSGCRVKRMDSRGSK